VYRVLMSEMCIKHGWRLKVNSVSLLRTSFNLKFLYKISVSQKKYVCSLISYYPQNYTEYNPDNNTSTLPHMMEICMYRFHYDL
jgi:hypothetical protein